MSHARYLDIRKIIYLPQHGSRLLFSIFIGNRKMFARCTWEIIEHLICCYYYCFKRMVYSVISHAVEIVWYRLLPESKKNRFFRLLLFNLGRISGREWFGAGKLGRWSIENRNILSPEVWTVNVLTEKPFRRKKFVKKLFSWRATIKTTNGSRALRAHSQHTWTVFFRNGCSRKSFNRYGALTRHSRNHADRWPFFERKAIELVLVRR